MQSTCQVAFGKAGKRVAEKLWCKWNNTKKQEQRIKLLFQWFSFKVTQVHFLITYLFLISIYGSSCPLLGGHISHLSNT